jgi:hypothetical protein
VTTPQAEILRGLRHTPDRRQSRDNVYRNCGPRHWRSARSTISLAAQPGSGEIPEGECKTVTALFADIKGVDRTDARPRSGGGARLSIRRFGRFGPHTAGEKPSS